MSAIWLSVDTATNVASAALVRSEPATSGGDVIVSVLAEVHENVNTHSTNLLPMVEQCMHAAGVSIDQIDAYVCGAGPGSFTGLRIGLATVKGLAYAKQKPLYLGSSLSGLADISDAADRPRAIITVMDGRRTEVFVAKYERQGSTMALDGQELVMSPQELQEYLQTQVAHSLVVGDGADLYVPGFEPPIAQQHLLGRFPRAALIAQNLQTAQLVDVLHHGAPSYIRLAEVQINFPNGMPGLTREEKLRGE